MTSIRNPYVGREGYHCFACCPDNPAGLHMSFSREGDEVVSRWQPRAELEGYAGVLHGGIQTTLMDEIASWWIFVNRGTAGATAHIEVDFKRPVLTAKGDVTLRASLAATDANLVTVAVALCDGSGALCSRGRVTYFTYPPALAKRRFAYPGLESFAEPEGPAR
jgi:acyl-coenzyme A thioesterase PaaI-like protein